MIDEAGNARFVLCQCANRSGKSEVLIERFSRHVFSSAATSKNKTVIISTNHAIIEDIILEPFFMRWGRDVIKSYNKQTHRMVMKSGHVVLLVSPENPDALESRSKVCAIFIDEPLTVPLSLFNAAKTRGIDCGAWFLIVGTPILNDISKPPVGIHWYKQICEMGRNPKYNAKDVPVRERYITFQWGMEANPYIPREEIELIRNDPFMSEAEKRCRLHGDFMDMGIFIFDPQLLDPFICGYLPEDLEKHHCETYQTVDLATGQRASAREDETAIITASVGADYTIFVRKCNAGRMPPGDIERNVIADYSTFDVTWSGIESVGFQTWFADSLRASQLHDGSMRFVKLDATGGMDGKPTRISKLVPFLENRRLRFPINQRGDFLHGTDKLVSQLKQMTFVKNENIHDDCADSLSYIVNPKMGIFTGRKRAPGIVGAKSVRNPVLSQADIRRIRSGPIPEDDFTGQLLSMASLN